MPSSGLIFSADAPNRARYDGVRCTAGDKEISLRANEWRDIRDRGAGFPPVGREKAVFDLTFDSDWSVSKIGPMRTLTPF